MEVDQNLSTIKLEPIEIKSETEGEITAQSIAGGQEFEDTKGPISGAGVIKTEPTEIKCEPKDEPVVEFNAQDVVGGPKFKKKEPLSNKHGVSQHIISKHKGDEDVEYFVCPTCGRKFRFKDQLSRHVKSHMTKEELLQTDGMYKCEQCQKLFRYKSSLRNHTKFFHNNEPKAELQCDHCAYRCLRKQILMCHIQKIHTPVSQLKTLICYECDFTTKFLADLNTHKYRYHGRRYQCPKCPFQTHSQANLNGHQRTHQKDREDKKYNCNKCAYWTYQCGRLKAHSLTHLKPEEIQYFYCFHCTFKYKYKRGLIAHIKRHFEREEVEFECHICDFKTKKRQIYSNHIGEHNKKLKS